MNELITEKIQLLEENYKAIQKKFLFKESLMNLVAGLIFTSADRKVDADKLTECKKIFASHVGIFSNMRKMMDTLIISKMALTDDPEKYIQDVAAVYKKLRGVKFSDNPYTILSSVLICDTGIQDDCDDIVKKADEIMKRMKKDHPFLTSSGDTASVILMALSYKDVDTLINDLEEGYEYIRNTYKGVITSDAAQGICEIFAMTYGDIKSKCDRFMKIYKAFKAKKETLYGDQDCIVLASLIDIDMTPEALAAEISETAVLIKDINGLDGKSLDESKRKIYAALIVSDAHGKDALMIKNPVITNTISMITTQKIVNMITVISNIAPSVIGAMVDTGDSTDKDTTQDTAPSVSGNSVSKAEKV